MKELRYQKIDYSFQINNSICNYLVIENPKLFTSFLNDLYTLNQEMFFLLDNEKILDIKKNIFIIENILTLDINSKKNISLFYDDLVKSNQDIEMLKNIELVNMQLSKIIYDIKLNSSLEITMKEVINLQDILQMYDVKIDIENTSLLEKIVIYLKLVNIIFKPSVIFIPFLDSFLDDIQLKSLLDEAKILEICLFIVSSSDKKLNNIHKIIVDNDLCVI